MAIKLGIEIYEWVSRLARRLAAKPNAQGIMQIPNQEVIRELSNDIITKFMKHNVPRDALKSENDIKVIYNQIKNIEEQTLAKNLKTALTPKKSGEVLDLTGKKIDTSKPISGGKNVPETEEQILERLNRQNKESVERLKNKKLTDPEDLAQGGPAGLSYLLAEDTNERIPFDKGKKVGKGMSRRSFLKVSGAGLTALASLPFVGKFFKAAKLAKPATSVIAKTGASTSMPSWFPAFVQKVLKQGDDVTETVAQTDRVVVKKMRLPKSKTEVYVETDLVTGDTAIDIGQGKHGWRDGWNGQPVRMQLRKGEEITEGKMRGKKTPDEFEIEEAEFSGGHPENVKFEESTTTRYGEHGSDFSELEEFATGKATKGSKAQKQVWEADWDDSLPDYEDYASGGVARMLGE